jgi:hypothetical protein
MANINKTTIVTFVIILCFIVILSMSVGFAANDTKENRVPKMKQVIASNFTFSNCILETVTTRTDCFMSAKMIFKSCTSNLTNVSETKNAVGKMCSESYKSSMSICQKVSKTQKNECRKIKHTSWEGFKSYFQ